MSNMRKRVRYVEVPMAYDIETTNYYDEGEKAAIVYSHAFSVDGEVHRLRTWKDVYSEMDYIVSLYNVTLQNRAVIYVHNLGFEFGFLRRYFNWHEVAAIGANHRIVRAVTSEGIEFRCSYLLTNAGLAYVGEEVGVKKLIGDLDYDLMRHSFTELATEELGYIDNDVNIIIELVRQRMAQDGGLGRIPMTSTGYVRRAVRKAVRKDPKYQALIDSLPLTLEDYTMARVAFSGGYVHANATYAGKVVEGVTGVDLASSYPASMIKGLYPLSPFMDVADPSLAKFRALAGKTCMLVDVTLRGVASRYPFPPISESKAVRPPVNATIDNGRVFAADEVRVIVTDVDLAVIMRAYDVEAISFNRIKAAKAGHLPKALGDAVLGYYADKTSLKGVKGQEERYMQGKANTNAIFGMTATDPVREMYEFDHDLGEMVTKEVSVVEALEDHNSSRSRFLYYPWACWITAYSRSTLLMAIYDLIDAGYIVLYCDTDSIYFVTADGAWDIINRHNEAISRRLAAYFPSDVDPTEALEMSAPRTVKGDRKPLGVFELDGVYDRFKALGAKRYATEKVIDGETRFQLTVSGLSKKAGDHQVKLEDGTEEWASGYVTQQGGMDFFKDGMTIPKEHSGRLVHTYSDRHVHNRMADHNGEVAEVEQWGFVHLEAVEYRLSLSPDYAAFILREQDRI